MAKQLFFSPIIGDGQSPNTAYRPSLADTVASVNATRLGAPSSPLVAGITIWMPRAGGVPIRNWCLCLVTAKDLRPFQNVAGVFPLPVFPYDGKVSAVQRVKLLGLIQKMQDLGIDTSFILNEDGSVKADGWREVVRGIGRAAGDTSFSEDNFDIPDIA